MSLALEGWKYCKEITIPSQGVAEALSNFPLTIYLTPLNFDFSKAKADGADIRFTDENLNFLKFEKQEYSATIGVINANIPVLNANKDNKIYMWYGNPNAFNTSIEAWQDKTGKQLTYGGNVNLEYISALGKRNAKFDGNGDFLQLASNAADFNFLHQLGSSGKWTIEMRAKFNSFAVAQTLFDTARATTVNHGIYIGLLTTRGISVQIYRGVSGSYVLQYDSAAIIPNDANYHFIEISYDHSLASNNLKIFVDGVLVAQATKTANAPSSAACQVPYISTYNGSANSINGNVDSIRITNGRVRNVVSYTIPSKVEIDGSDVALCANFDTIWDNDYILVNHMDSRLIDASGNANNGVATGTTQSSNAYGLRRNFTTNCYINILDSNSLDLTSAITLLALGRYTNTDNKTFIEKSNNNTNYQFQVGAGLAGRMEFRGGGSTIAAGSSVSYADGVDRVFIGTNENTALKLIVNGVLVASATQANPTANTSPLRIGARSAGTGFTGSLNEVRLSKKVRSINWSKLETLALLNQVLEIKDYIIKGKGNSLFFGFNF